MMIDSEQTRLLLERYFSGEASDEETREVYRLLDAHRNDDVWEELFLPVFDRVEKEKEYKKEEWEPVIQAILQHSEKAVTPVRYIDSFRRWGWAAAIFLIMAGAGIWWFIAQNRNDANQIAVTTNGAEKLLPGGDKAVLVLGDGSKIILDSMGMGQLAQQNGTMVYKSGSGQISYREIEAQREKKQEPVINTLVIPKGGQFRLELPDGTNVWLNAASSITYPTVFTGDERVVSITGEVYFEVAKHKAVNGNGKMPFKVNVQSGTGKDMEITVLGTHFNVNAYANEPAIKTTLLEGSVKLKKDNDQYLLQPGQQAQFNKNGSVKIEADIDAEEIVAWKNGFFYFRHADLPTVMRQLERWYDVEVEYQGAIPDMKFGGEIPRSADAAQVLKILEATKIRFTVEGKKIIVMP